MQTKQVRNVSGGGGTLAKFLVKKSFATLLLDRLRDFILVLSSASGNASLEKHSQSTEERSIWTDTITSILHGHSGMCA